MTTLTTASATEVSVPDLRGCGFLANPDKFQAAGALAALAGLVGRKTWLPQFGNESSAGDIVGRWRDQIQTGWDHRFRPDDQSSIAHVLHRNHTRIGSPPG